MLGLSFGELFFTLGAIAALIGPKDLPIIARTAGRLAGKSIAYVQLARGQIESVMQQSQFRQVNKELQDTMAQLEAIRYEMRSFSIMNPGPLTQKVVDNVTQSNSEKVNIADAGLSTKGVENSRIDTDQAHPLQNQQLFKYNFTSETRPFKEHASVASTSTNLHSQGIMYSKLAEAQALKVKAAKGSGSMDKVDDSPGLLSVLPVSAESAGLLPKRHGEVTGADIVLEALLEADVARNAKEFFSQPQNQIKAE